MIVGGDDSEELNETVPVELIEPDTRALYVCDDETVFVAFAVAEKAAVSLLDSENSTENVVVSQTVA